MSAEAVLRGSELPAREFCQVLMNEVKNRHARLHHPFYLALYEGKLSLDDIRVWAREAWGIFAYNVAINTAKLVRCQLSGIHDPQIQKKFVEIIHSEVGYEYFEGSPRPVPGHRALFLRFGESIGIPAAEFERREREEDFLPTTVLARAGWLDIALRSPSILEQVASTNCCNEFSNQLTGGRFFRAFKNHYGLEERDIEFFAEHGEADTEHSNIGYELVERFATTHELQLKVLKALRKGLGIWWALTDGVARECERRNKRAHHEAHEGHEGFGK
ncbi:MAG TPA: iron-containing redox enzyme family protein [Candidatus Eisenbacteria bacterium]|nr:iron-containing redox enzyme family protein [Candidatus Eisenbacteria bacterium]